jgi:hypothetical protein
MRGRLRWNTAWLPAASFLLVFAMNPILAPVFDTNYAWAGLRRVPDRNVAFTKSKDFVAGKTYRVLRGNSDGKVGMYEYLKAGAKLDSEFFPEGFAHRRFHSSTRYSALLRKRLVDVVVVYSSYDRMHFDEHPLLERLAARGTKGCTADTVGVSVLVRRPTFTAYSIVRDCPGPR